MIVCMMWLLCGRDVGNFVNKLFYDVIIRGINRVMDILLMIEKVEDFYSRFLESNECVYGVINLRKNSFNEEMMVESKKYGVIISFGVFIC